MKHFIHVDDNGQPLDEVREAFVPGWWIDEELRPFVFRVTITAENTFRADVLNDQREAFVKVAGTNRWLKRVREWSEVRNEFCSSPDPESGDVEWRDDAPPKSPPEAHV